MGFSRSANVNKEIINSFLQKNYKNAYIKKSPYFKGYRGCGKLSDVLEFTSNATHMQQVCNKDIDMYRTFFSSNTGECPFFLNLINRIYKLLYIKMCINLFCQSHSTGVSYNLFDNRLINTDFC